MVDPSSATIFILNITVGFVPVYHIVASVSNDAHKFDQTWNRNLFLCSSVEIHAGQQLIFSSNVGFAFFCYY